tara:strand:+ start:1837 stop:2988 length:1152 start_codon:yes stop_codon:yes gene_type:complete
MEQQYIDLIKKIARIFIDGYVLVFYDEKIDKVVIDYRYDAIRPIMYSQWLESCNENNVNQDDILILNDNFAPNLDMKNLVYSFSNLTAMAHALQRDRRVLSSDFDKIPYDKNYISFLKGQKKIKKFLSYNGSFHPHRLLLVNALHELSLIKDGLISYKGSVDVDEFNLAIEKITKKSDSFKYKKLNSDFVQDSPYHLDVLPEFLATNDISMTENVNTDLYAEGMHFTWVNFKHIESVYFNVVTETDFNFEALNKNVDYVGFVTEKTVKALLTQPFILVGVNGSLKFLRELGFKTFPMLFDESYDEIEDDSLRLNKIIEEIDRVCKLDDDELQELYGEALEVVIHNQNIILSFDEPNTYLRELSKRKPETLLYPGGGIIGRKND